MYCAFGLFATYATMTGFGAPVEVVIGTTAPAEFSAVTSLPVPFTPLGLRIARSPALSPLTLESTPLRTPAFSPDAKLSVPARLKPPRSDRANQFRILVKNGRL